MKKYLLNYCFDYSLRFTISILFFTYSVKSYAQLYTNDSFNARTINTSLAVGSTAGSAGVTSGAATYSIPIPVPPGTNGVSPSIAINYNSLGGDGILGRGWDLSGLSMISRVGQSRYFDNSITSIQLNSNDRFALDGSRLLNLSGAYGANGTTYGTEVENFATIVSNGVTGSGPSSFTVTSKEGTIMEFGQTTDSRVMSDNGQEVMFWLLNKITEPGGNYIAFKYTGIDRDFRIDEINYTGNALTGLTPYNTIKFNYVTRNVPTTIYIGGASVTSKYLLDHITITNENSTFKSFHFSYGWDNVNSFLKDVTEKGADGSFLNSTLFKYGDKVEDVNSGSLAIPLGNDGIESLFGDFNGDGVSDLLTSTLKNNDQFGIKYISQFKIWKKDPNGGFFPNPIIKDVPTTSSYTSQAKPIPSVNGLSHFDVNGDGVDDIVLQAIQYVPQGGGYNRLNKIAVYQSVNGGADFNLVEQDAPQADGYAYTRLHNNGRFFYNGDFDGDGITEYLTIVGKDYSILDPGSDYKMFFYNNTPGQINSYTEITQFVNITRRDFYLADKIETLDFNGDGRTDILFVWGNESEIVTLDSPNSIRSIYKSSSFPKKDQQLLFGDFNGDGKTDILVESTSVNSLDKYISTGKGFVNSSITLNYGPLTPSSLLFNYLVLGDFNGDGKSDLYYIWVWRKEIVDNSGKKFHDYYYGTDIYYSQGNTFFLKSLSYQSEREEQPFFNNQLAIIFPGHQRMVGDINGDGRSDLVEEYSSGSLRYSLFNKDSKEFLLEKVKNGFNHVTKWNYESLSKGGALYTKGTGTSNYPLNIIQPAFQVVSSTETQDGIGGNSTILYSYEGARLHLGGKGFLGFSKVFTSNVTMGVATVNENKFNATYFTSVPAKERTYLYPSNSTVSETIIEEDELLSKGGKRFIYQVKKSSSKDFLADVITTTTNTYDDYGNIKVTTVKNPVETTTTTLANFQAYGSTIPRLPKTKIITKTRLGQAAFTVTTSFDYTSIGQLKSQIDFDGQDKKVTAVYDYFGLGNLKSTSVTPSGMATRTTSATYDSKGRYAETSTNELGLTAFTQYHSMWGKPIKTTGIDGLVTEYDYDAFGRAKLTKLPEGYTINQSYTWAISGKEVYYSTLQHPGKPDEKTYYDVLGREVRSQTEGMNGQWITQTQSYNAKGQVEANTEPYIEGQESPIVNTTSYDEYGRPSSITKTGLGTGTVTYSYEGGNLITRTTLPGQPTTTKTTDASGQVISASDPGGTLTYTYYSHGGLKEVKKDNVLITSSEYDAYGKQTKLVDKNAGTTTYDYNALGELVSQTNAKGQTHTLQYDLIGRLEVRTGPEGTTRNEFYPPTEAHKPSINQLKKITGFAGNTTEYTYDGYGRVKTEKQTIDGAAYTTTYDYNTYGDVTSTAYGSGFGITHHYDGNGYLTKITSNANGTTLYQTGSLNGLGQVKAYSLGNGKSSTISYEKGIPTRYYTPGIQDLHMNWDVERGNLTFREDVIKNKKENFTYDNLNRLLTAKVEGLALKEITYAPSGNIETKSDAGTYTYLSTKPNAIEYVTNPQGVIPDAQQDILYTAFMQPQKVSEKKLSENAYELDYTYGEDYERIKGVLKQGGSTLYTRYYLGEYEKTNNKFIHYIGSPAGLIAIVVRESGNDTYHYTYTDHLGSILTVTNAGGTVEAEQNFDAWGRRRNATTWDYANVAARPDWLYRGYTGHEHLDEFGLINMNGRLYDPVTGRMLSPDNYVQDPTDTQSFNRYSYAFNNPLRYNDPSGNISFSAILEFTVKAVITIGAAYVTGGAALGILFPAIAGATTAVAGGAALASLPSFAATVTAYAVSGAIGGAISGATGAYFNNSNVLKGALLGGITGAITGGITGYLTHQRFAAAYARNLLNDPLSDVNKSTLFASIGDPPTEAAKLPAGSNFGSITDKELFKRMLPRQDYSGFLGKVDYLLTGGVVNGWQYNWDGTPTGELAAVTGAPPNGAFGKAAKAYGMGKYIVYKGTDANGIVRYIGITSRNAAVRWKEHIASNSVRSNLNYTFVNKMSKNLSRRGAKVWEQMLINYYGLQKKGGTLVNEINSIDRVKWARYGIK